MSNLPIGRRRKRPRKDLRLLRALRRAKHMGMVIPGREYLPLRCPRLAVLWGACDV